MGWLIDTLPLPYPDAVVVVGSAILGLTAGVLGSFACFRRRSLVGDAVAHAALPGVCVAFLLAGGAGGATVLGVGAAVAGVLGVLAMVAMERARRVRPDTSIGVVLAGFSSLGVVLLTSIGNRPDADQAGLEGYLFGQAAGLLERDLVVMAALGSVGIGLVAALYRRLKVVLFDPGFAGSLGLPVRPLEVLMTAFLVIAVVVGLRTVGAILMVALLVVPVVAARQLAGRLSTVLPLAGVIGAGVGVGGALLSVRTGLPTGPVVVLVGLAVVVTCVLVAPGRGVLWRTRTLAGQRNAILRTELLVELAAADAGRRFVTPAELAETTGRSQRSCGRATSALLRCGHVERHGSALRPTTEGRAALAVEEDRRTLWSSWLLHGWTLGVGHVGTVDPLDLRASLGDELVADLAAMAEHPVPAGPSRA